MSPWKSDLSYSGFSRTEALSCIFPEYIIVIDTLVTHRISQWLPDPWNAAHYGRKDQGGTVSFQVELPPPPTTKIMNPKKYHNPGRMAQISVTIKYLKDPGVVILTTLIFNSCSSGAETR